MELTPEWEQEIREWAAPHPAAHMGVLKVTESRNATEDIRALLAEIDRLRAKRGEPELSDEYAATLEKIREFAAGHHGDQEPHVLLHALKVDIPEMVSAVLSPDSAPAPSPSPSGEALDALEQGGPTAWREGDEHHVDTDSLRTIRDFATSPEHAVEVDPETAALIAAEILRKRFPLASPSPESGLLEQVGAMEIVGNFLGKSEARDALSQRKAVEPVLRAVVDVILDGGPEGGLGAPPGWEDRLYEILLDVFDYGETGLPPACLGALCPKCAGPDAALPDFAPMQRCRNCGVPFSIHPKGRGDSTSSQDEEVGGTA